MSPRAIGKWLAAFIAAQWLAIPGASRNAMFILVTLMGIDIVTGLWASYVTGQMSSEHGFKGISRKLAMLVFLLVAHFIEQAVGLELNVELAGAMAYSLNEGISIIENFYRLGVPIPSQLVAALLQAKNLKFNPATTQQMKALKDPQGNSTDKA